ncbi:hypothetical protein E0L93_05645 [Rubrobacter taiwanensis]|jgi:signal transduction histidine kinase|uniref:Sensor-like histidine kinase SenX3 n=1 Tax=Rubrobacter taiwanensis TaxID=185139 RepID=A0A4R1BM42_9ACTN|nr:CHASE domain-containing protein [Rubrobacter taiwanensis]TCJ18474.1 hypothetical protein E0L93_05645 [Rubrobacter taiwanensis]
MAVAYAVLAGALFLTGVAWYYVSQNARTQEQSRFDEAAQRTLQAVDRRMNTYVDAMFGTRGLFAASRSVERGEFRAYVRSLDLRRRYPGIQALGYARRVPAGGLEAHVESVREEGYEGYEVRPGGRGESFPLVYVEPEDAANRSMFLGRNMYAAGVHRAAMDRARDVNLPRASGKVAPGGPAGGPGFMIYLPVYRNGAPVSTVPERREALQGYVVAVFRARELLEDIFIQQGDPSVDFKVYDGAEFGEEYLLYDRGSTAGADGTGPAPLFSQTSTLQVGGRLWILRFSTLPGFGTSPQENLPRLVLYSGLALSLVLFGLTAMLARSRTQAERARSELEEANRELESFSYTVSHDLRAPLRSINGFSSILQEDYAGRLDEEGRDYLRRVSAASQNMGRLIDALLDFSRLRNRKLRTERVDLSGIARSIADELARRRPERRVEFAIQPGVTARGDPDLLRVALENLLGNAFKFTGKQERARIEFGVEDAGGAPIYFVRDNGPGFDMAYADKLFGAFQRLHKTDEFEGTGIGLATVRRIVERHGGEIRGVGAVGRGAAFYFTLDLDREKPSRRKQRFPRWFRRSGS